MTVRRSLLIALALVAMLSVAAPASAYQEEVADWTQLPMARQFMPDPEDPSTWTIPDPLPCSFCHGSGTDDATPPTGSSGPHGGYITTSNKCATCHSVHAAPAGSLVLLPAATVKSTCETCHDGTGGTGVYGVIKARTGVDPLASHRIDVTNVVPGGDSSTGGSDATRVFAGQDGNLTCTDCHSPHGSNLVEPFTGDRGRSAYDAEPDTTVTSSRLLRRELASTTNGIGRYDSDWCGTCHQGRVSGATVHNHPVETATTQPDAGLRFHYDKIVRAGQAQVVGTLGHNNFGYVMPDPRVAEQVADGGHLPICQQCHEDVRSVGNAIPQTVDPSENFVISGAGDGDVPTDNPRYQTFPHESQNQFFLVEAADSLCLNCHDPANLP